MGLLSYPEDMNKSAYDLQHCIEKTVHKFRDKDLDTYLQYKLYCDRIRDWSRIPVDILRRDFLHNHQCKSKSLSDRQHWFHKEMRDRDLLLFPGWHQLSKKRKNSDVNQIFGYLRQDKRNVVWKVSVAFLKQIFLMKKFDTNECLSGWLLMILHLLQS